jgi:hypothetical protein
MDKKDMKASLADIIEMSDEVITKEELFECGKVRVEEYGYMVTDSEIHEVIGELWGQYYS